MAPLPLHNAPTPWFCTIFRPVICILLYKTQPCTMCLRQCLCRTPLAIKHTSFKRIMQGKLSIRADLVENFNPVKHKISVKSKNYTLLEKIKIVRSRSDAIGALQCSKKKLSIGVNVFMRTHRSPGAITVFAVAPAIPPAIIPSISGVDCLYHRCEET